MKLFLFFAALAVWRRLSKLNMSWKSLSKNILLKKKKKQAFCDQYQLMIWIQIIIRNNWWYWDFDLDLLNIANPTRMGTWTYAICASWIIINQTIININHPTILKNHRWNQPFILFRAWVLLFRAVVLPAYPYFILLWVYFALF